MKIHIRFLSPLLTVLFALYFVSCQKKETLQETETEPEDTIKPIICPDCEFPDTAWKNTSTAKQLVFRLKFDSMQIRLNDQGLVSLPAAGTGAQSPSVTGMGLDYIELMPNANTALGAGVLLYKTKETTCGGNKATNFCKALVVGENEVLFSVDLKSIPPGSYPWIRISIAYQELRIMARSVSAGNTKASFAGFSSELTYLSKTKIDNAVLTPTVGGTGNKNRGYWLFYQDIFNLAYRLEGQSPQTTVVNPNTQAPNTNALSFVYGEFVNSTNSSTQALNINGNELSDIEVTLSISTNKSFEWTELTHDGIFQPEIGEKVLDFGCRGLIPKF